MQVKLKEYLKRILKKIFKNLKFYSFSVKLYILPLTQYLFPRELVDEFKSLAIGIQKNRYNPSIFNLIRNLHRLEKGLTFKERRKTFAIDYIGETLDEFYFFYSKEEFKPYQLYAINILTIYFNFIPSELLKSNREKLWSFLKEKGYNAVSQSNTQSFFHQSKTQYSDRDQQFLQELILNRRSVRDFEKLHSTDLNKISNLIQIATSAPSACNRLPYRFICCTGDIKKQVINIPMGTAGWNETVDLFVVLVGDLSAYFDIRDRHAPYIDGSLSLMQLVLLLESHNYGSCIVNWSDIPAKNKEMKSTLQLRKNEIIITTLAIGNKKSEYLTPVSKKRITHEFRK